MTAMSTLICRSAALDGLRFPELALPEQTHTNFFFALRRVQLTDIQIERLC
jgi:hypothetical protein